MYLGNIGIKKDFANTKYCADRLHTVHTIGTDRNHRVQHLSPFYLSSSPPAAKLRIKQPLPFCSFFQFFFFRCSCGVIQHCSFVYFTHMCVWFSFGLWAKSIHFAVCSLDALFASPAFNCTLDVVFVINLRFCSLYCNF